MSEQEIHDQLKQFILDEFLPDTPPEELEDDTPLRSGGVLDSIATIKVVAHVEQAFNVSLDAHEMGEFDTLAELVALVCQKHA
jgi:acyl carrier protein